MKIKFGSIVTDGRGKLGGQVYARNRSGAYVRNKVTPNNPQTLYQSLQRAVLATFSEAWRGLTQQQREAWNAAGESFPTTNQFGDQVIPTGKNLFTRLNNNLTDISQSTLTNPPLPAPIVEPEDLEADANADAQTLTLDFNGDNAMGYKIFATPPLSPGVGFFKNKFKMIQTLSTAPPGTILLTDDYLARFGAFQAGQKIAIKVVPVVAATGQKGVGKTVAVIAVDTP